MRLALVTLFAFALTTTAQAEHGLPSDGVLADMGLSGMRILSDHEGLAIRGLGNGPKDREPTERFLWYVQGVTDLRTHVTEYKSRLAGRSSNVAGRFSDNKSSFRSSISGFKGKIGG